MARRIQGEAAAPAQAGARENRPVPILMYHSISNQATPRFRTFATRPEAFAEQMADFAAHNYCPITVTHLVRAIAGIGAALPARPVV